MAEWACRQSAEVIANGGRAFANPDVAAMDRNSAARGLGMNDFGGFAGKSLSDGAVLFFDQLKDLCELRYGFFHCRHERVAPGNRRDLSHPAIGLVPIDYELVVVEADATIVGQVSEVGAQ